MAAFRTNNLWCFATGVAGTLLLSAVVATQASAQQRVLGVDVSYWNRGSSSASANGITQAMWNTAYSTPNANGYTREFAWVRATRGGTTGLDQGQGTPSPGGSQSTLSRRYDDPEFLRTMTRATNAGLFAAPYHFARPDVAGNTGTDEANHFIEYASAYMRPGYLMPVFDLEAGINERTANQLAQFSIDFSNRLYEVMRIRPAMYINGQYSSPLQNASVSLRDQLAKPVGSAPSVVGPAYPMLWNARYANQDNPESIPVQTGNPKNTPTINSSYYGPWDDYGDSDPWSFWQYASTVSVPGINQVDSTIDGNVSHGDIEYVKNYLVPAVWWHDSSGDWGTMTNWNSGQPLSTFNPNDLNNPPGPYVPRVGDGQTTPFAGYTLPVPRLPGTAGSGPASTSGIHDTVILERPNADITVTLSNGSYNIRKLYMRETLEITGGSLTINYDPTYRPDNSATVKHGGPISAQFSGPVTLGGTGALNVHTLQVDSTRTFTLGGGTLTFNRINLMPHASNPATISVTGEVAVNPLNNVTATIANGSGGGSSGRVSMAGGSFNVGNGTNPIDLSVDVPIIGGALTKTGLGTMRLGATNSHTGQTTVQGGVLMAIANNQLGSAGVAIGSAGTLQLSGNVSYALPITIGGGGASGVSLTAPGNPGALDSTSGNNVWSGAVTLAGTGTGGVDPLMNQISAQAGSLRLSGVLQNAVAVDAAWAKTGNGDVILSGANPNTYTGLTRVFGGRLVIEKDGALGAAGSASGAGGNTFQLGGSASTIAFSAPNGSGGLDYSTFEVINTHGTGAPGYGQIDSFGGNNSFVGQIAFDGPDVGGTREGSISVTNGSFHVSGGLFARGNDGSPRRITKLGTGKLILSGDGGAATANPLVAPLTNSTFNVDSGTVEMHGPTGTTTNLPGVITWNVNNSSTLNAASGRFATNQVNVSAGGQFKISGGSAVIHTLGLLAGGNATIEGGTLHVNTVQGSLTNVGGTLAPGNPAGATFITSNYTQQSGGTLEIELGGEPQTPLNDIVIVSGVATLDGILDVSLLNDFMPSPGQQFVVLGASSIVNHGLSLAGPAAELFSLLIDTTTVVLEAVSTSLPGDYNSDGRVDAADYVVWRKNMADQPSYDEWQANFGQPAGGGSIAAGNNSMPANLAVPEPASAALVMLCISLLGCVGSRRRL